MDEPTEEPVMQNIPDILEEIQNKKARLHSKSNIVDMGHQEESMIQDKFTMIVQKLNQRKEFINSRLELVGKTELISNILKYKMYEVRYDCKKRLDELFVEKEKFKHACIKDLTEMQISVKMEQINMQLKEEQKNMEDQMLALKQQKITMQLEYEDLVNMLDIDMQDLLDLFNNLLNLIDEEKLNASASDEDLINERANPIIDEFKQDLYHLNKLQFSGWKEIHSEEKIADLLEEKGLKITKDGLLITRSGRLLTFQEAKSSEYLRDLDIDIEVFTEITKSETTLSGRSETADQKSSTDYSRMDSEDVAYLKENLGKPLTMALTEITSVQPKDPIHYLGHWLFKYRYNRELDDVRQVEMNALTEERDRLAKERWHKFLEEEARAAVMEMIVKAEELAMEKELKRIADEMAALADEEENLDEEAKDVLGEYTGPPVASAEQ